LTLSIEQKKLAEERVALAGLSDSITVHLLDYRLIPEAWNGTFDRVISIEMIEAVGLDFLPTYFATIDRVLKKDIGLACFQVITIPESRFDRYRHEVDFIRRYIFPGGILPSITCLMDAIHKGSAQSLTLEHLENIGPRA
jgi:cyclopropane-fatty-acyl-phospholipid synthase